MATYEMDLLLQRKDKNGNTEILYPITTADNVLGFDEKIPDASRIKLPDDLAAELGLSEENATVNEAFSTVFARAVPTSETMRYFNAGPEDVDYPTTDRAFRAVVNRVQDTTFQRLITGRFI